jgi:putative Mg2+ transporter-C (MgtC) family protein
MSFFTAHSSLPFLEVLLRLFMAFVCGAVIGLNREFHHKPAGFRTFALVSLGSAVVVIAMEGNEGSGSDAMSRVIQGILTGIGFLGAGVIFRRQAPNKVSGLTTAAAVWLTAGLGVAAGMGQYGLALAATGIALVLLLLGGPFERLITGNPRNKNEPEAGDDDEDAP